MILMINMQAMNFKPNENFKYYMYFASERMNIFWERFYGFEPPYTDDPILNKHKFTNVYRVLDRSSQYLLSKVIYNGKIYSKEDMVFRIILYKHFNLPSTWDLLIERFGDIDLSVTEKDLVEFFKEKTEEHRVLYSNAYMITASFMRSVDIMGRFDLFPGMPKYQSYMRLIFKGLFEDGIMKDICGSNTFKECFDYLQKMVGVADFLAYQFTQDLNYTEFFNFDDNEFCAAGPGTQRGIERCFTFDGKTDYQEVVKWVQSNFKQLVEEYGFPFEQLKNHPPTVPDLSNCFCETDKMLRGMGIVTEGKEIDGKRIKQVFTESPDKVKYVFPPKWHINL
jgi:hypothetical protein